MTASHRDRVWKRARITRPSGAAGNATNRGPEPALFVCKTPLRRSKLSSETPWLQSNSLRTTLASPQLDGLPGRTEAPAARPPLRGRGWDGLIPAPLIWMRTVEHPMTIITYADAGPRSVPAGRRPVICGLGMTELGKVYGSGAAQCAGDAVRLAAADAGVAL